MLKIKESKGNVRRWCWQALSSRKNENRPKKKDKDIVKKAMQETYKVRFSATSESTYIETNETLIRVSSHVAKEDLHQIPDYNIIIKL